MSNQATDAEMIESSVSVAQHERSPVAGDEAIPPEAPSAPHPPTAPAETVPPNHHHDEHEHEPSSSPSPSSDDELEEWEVQRNHHKSLGDDAYKNQQFQKAITHYTSALSVDPQNVILYSNRSAAYLSSNLEKSKALQDGRKCIELDSNFIKGHSRVAAALYSLGRYDEAKLVFYRIQRLETKGGVSGATSGGGGTRGVAKKGIEDCERMQAKVKQWQEDQLEKQRVLAKELERKEQEEKERLQREEQEQQEAEAAKKDDGDGEEDLLADFFDDVEEPDSAEPEISSSLPPPPPPTTPSHIKIQVSELGTTETQINRLHCSNHEWFNLNPFRVLGLSHLASPDLINRRYKALSLLLHPDKVRHKHADLVDKAEVSFEYVRKAMIALKDEDKAKHVVSLVEQGVKNGKREYEIHKVNRNNSSSLEEYQDKATMKIFAEIERKRRDVDRRKRKFEMREREQEDAELDRSKKERRFDKSWKEENRVENRIGNWRDFQKKGK